MANRRVTFQRIRAAGMEFWETITPDDHVVRIYKTRNGLFSISIDDHKIQPLYRSLKAAQSEVEKAIFESYYAKHNLYRSSSYIISTSGTGPVNGQTLDGMKVD